MRHVRFYGDLGGWRGTARTIREMHALVNEGKKHPTVIYLATQLARRHHKDDYWSQADEIFKWIKKNIHYVRDPNGVELLRSPFWTLYYRAGDCDDQSVLFSALAQAIGFPTRFKTVKADPSNPREFSHVYSQVSIPGRGWVSADTIVPYATFGWETDKGTASELWEGRPAMQGEFVTSAMVEQELSGLGQFTTESEVEQAVAGFRGLRGLGSPLNWGQILTGAITGAVGIVGTQLQAQTSQIIQSNLGTPQTAAQAAASAQAAAPAPAPGMPGWVLPVGIVGGAGLLAGLVIFLKRRK